MTRRINILKDYSDEKLVFHSQQDCTEILERNERDRNDGPNDSKILGRKIASVPLSILEQWKREGVDYAMITHDVAMRQAFYRKLREYKKLLTYTGGIGK